MGKALLALLLVPGLALADALPGAVAAPTKAKADAYVFSSSHPEVLLDHGAKVVAEDGSDLGDTGANPLLIRLENLGMQPTQVTLIFREMRGKGAEIRRTVALGGGVRAVTSLPLPAGHGYGLLEAHSPAAPAGGKTYVHLSPVRRLLLTVGSEADFEKDSGASPTSSSYGTAHVRAMDPADLPGDLSSYTGFDAVVVSAPLDTLPERGRRALEAYAVTGGTLILEQPTRRPSAYLPLLAPDATPDVPRTYGFGTVVACDGVEACRARVKDALKAGSHPPVILRGHRGFDMRMARIGPVPTEPFLVPEVTAPKGLFLAIILLFSLVIGPGSIWIARRWSAMHLLITIPATALVTCILIAGMALVKDGFALRAGTRSITLLDVAHHRAITDGVAGFYANVSPGPARFDDGAAVTGHMASVDWTDGARFGDDFIPSRTYREWAIRAVAPTRARLVVRREAGGVTVENALGGEIRRAWIIVDGKMWRVENVPNGGAASARRTSTVTGAVQRAFAPYFDPRVFRRLGSPSEEGRFLAVMKGPGLLPLGGLHIQSNHSRALVLGEVSR